MIRLNTFGLSSRAIWTCFFVFIPRVIPRSRFFLLSLHDGLGFGLTDGLLGVRLLGPLPTFALLVLELDDAKPVLEESVPGIMTLSTTPRWTFVNGLGVWLGPGSSIVVVVGALPVISTPPEEFAEKGGIIAGPGKEV